MEKLVEELQLRFRKDVVDWGVPALQEQELWVEIKNHYGDRKRAYHNLQHLQTLFQWADQYQALLLDPVVVTWAIWYHDIVYNARRQDNEEQSALLAKKRLLAIGLPIPQRDTVLAYIRATARHLRVEAQGDLAFFLDFDLAILGARREEYELYAAAVRQEYRHVPGFLYRRGRKKVLRYFLEAPQLYRTKTLRELLETKARENMRWELKML